MHHVRVDVSLEVGGARDLTRLKPVADRFGWAIENYQPKSASIVVAIEGSGKRSAWKKAQKLVEENTKHIAGLRVNLVIVRPFQFSLVNGYKIYGRPVGRRSFARIRRILDSPIGKIYSSPDSKSKHDSERSELIAKRINPDRQRYLIKGRQVEIKSAGGYLRDSDAARIESQSESKWILAAVLILLAICTIFGSGSGWFFHGATAIAWKFVVSFVAGVLFVAFESLVYVASREGFKRAERLFFHLYPLGTGVVLGAVFWNADALSWIMPLVSIMVCLVFAVLWIGITISLIYPNTKAVIVQGPFLLGFLFGGFKLYSDYRVGQFVTALNVPVQAVSLPTEIVFEIAFMPSLVIAATGFAIISVTGWVIYYHGSGDISWSQIVYGSFIYLIVASMGLFLSVLIMSESAARDAKHTMLDSKASYEYYGMHLRKVCAEPHVSEPLIQFGEIDYGLPYWYFMGEDMDIWLLRVEKDRSADGSAEFQLNTVPILVSSSEIRLEHVDDDLQTC